MKMEAIRHIQPKGLDGMKNALKEVEEEWARQVAYHNGNPDEVSVLITYNDRHKATLMGNAGLQELQRSFSKIAKARLI